MFSYKNKDSTYFTIFDENEENLAKPNYYCIFAVPFGITEEWNWRGG